MWIFVVALWVVAVWLGVMAATILLPLTLAATTLGAVGVYFTHAGRVLLPAPVSGPSPVRLPSGGPDGDPVYPHYLVRQVWRDWWAVIGAALPAIGDTAGTVVSATTRKLMGDVQGFFLFPIWLAICGGVVLAAVPLAAVGVLLAAVHGVTVLAGMLAWLACVAVLRGLEQVLALVRRILQTCPYPGCYERITLPHYSCPTCGERHRRLTPDLNGAIRHVCRCGTRLPTTIALGRFRLRAHCPECDRALPARIGRVRVEPLPFVGGPDAGKTTFMALAVNALHGSVVAAGGHALFADRGDEMSFRRLREQLRAGRVDKTGTDLPRAVMLDVSVPATRRREGDRILYLFDPSGEHYTGAATVEAMGYLAHGEALLLVIDPFALPEVQDHLLAAEREELAARGVVLSGEDPADTFSRVVTELAARSDGGGQRRVAVVLTKADLLRGIAAGRGAEDDLPGWLTRMGMGNLVREVTRRSAGLRYFASGLPPRGEEIAELIGWLVGLPLGGRTRGTAADPAAGERGTGEQRAGEQGAEEQGAGEQEAGDLVAGDPRTPWTPSSRPADLLPLSYLLARRVIFGATVLLSAGLIVLLAAALWRINAGDVTAALSLTG
ncbi:hypothetical protein OG339_17790 [Streptosporangium sp. NBC_01495]|uniref:TRAFAC clade GTPase domain-containing protein n=1 Tax=Streptosporangium sp. NBC_01495 TaxID=2903899 RepID=UPI002E381BCA|nr:hypothetical protein [Streptosporangium sp. NBC_01495]